MLTPLFVEFRYLQLSEIVEDLCTCLDQEAKWAGLESPQNTTLQMEHHANRASCNAWNTLSLDIRVPRVVEQ